MGTVSTTRFLLAIFTMGLAAMPISAWPDAAKIADIPIDAARLAQVLGVRSIGKSVTLTEPTDRVCVRVVFYKNGRLLRRHDNMADLNTQGKHNHFNISVVLIDSDHLQTGDTPKNHYRIDVQAEEDSTGSTASSNTFNISKADFGKGSGTAEGSFDDRRVREYHDPVSDAVDGTMMEIPIAYCIKHENVYSTGTSPEETLRENPNADIMIVYFVYHLPDSRPESN